MSKKKLTILIDWYLPGTKAGGPVRSIYSLIPLLKNDFDIYVITTNTDLGSNQGYKDIVPNKWFEKEQLHYYYFSKDKLDQTSITQVLTELNSDVVYVNSFWSYWFSIFIVQLKNKGILKSKVIIAPRGMLGKGALSIKPFKKQAYLFVSKLRRFYDHVVFHATNEQEVKDIKQQYKQANICLIENLSTATPLQIAKTKKVNELDLFYLSRISPVKNLHFALEVLGRVSSEYTVNYDIYGNIEDKNYWDQCKQLIQKLPAHIHVNYKGELSFHEVQPTMATYHYLFLPTLNENFGHSIVESLMSGCPVIISDQTPWNDIEKVHAGFAIVLDEKNKFVQAIEHGAKLDQLTYNDESKAAIDYINAKINLTLIQNKYIQLFNGAN